MRGVDHPPAGIWTVIFSGGDAEYNLESDKTYYFRLGAVAFSTAFVLPYEEAFSGTTRRLPIHSAGEFSQDDLAMSFMGWSGYCA
jgi:hypothetical protein